MRQSITNNESIFNKKTATYPSLYLRGYESLESTKHGTPAMDIRVAIAAPFKSFETSNDNLLTAGNETIPHAYRKMSK